jgi:uncharacterized protein (TIRG00374 family)
MRSSTHAVRTWAGFAISAVFLFLALRRVDWAEVWTSWQAARLPGLAGGATLLVAAWLVSAIRWKVILAPAPSVTIRDAFSFITIGYLANTILPLRLGDLARATLIGRQRGLGISRALGSMALERVMDIGALLAVVLALTALMEIPLNIRAGIATMAGGAGTLLVGLVALALNRARLAWVERQLARVLPSALAARAVTLADRFCHGLTVLHRPARLLGVYALSLGVWGVTGAATLVWVRAFNLDVPWFAGLFVLVVINLGSAIPSSPGYVGVYHFLAVLALGAWRVEHGPALAYAIGTHALNMLANVVFGAIALSREGVSLKTLGADETLQVADAVERESA